jgi:hypothetical protein
MCDGCDGCFVGWMLAETRFRQYCAYLKEWY